MKVVQRVTVVKFRVNSLEWTIEAYDTIED